ncbi:hypothetical protein V8E54_002304 [Elaphomyces granulatus]
MPPHCASFHRPRTRILRIFCLAAVAGLGVIWLSLRSFDQIPNFWADYPSLPFLPPPEQSQVLTPKLPSVGENGTLPNNLLKSNPSLHVLMPARAKSQGLCRSIASVMLLNYPPPTIIQSGNLSSSYTLHDAVLSQIRGIISFLEGNKHVNQSDLVLIADGADAIFQLPPEVLIRRFQKLVWTNNEKLRKKYGIAVTEDQGQEGVQKTVQKYSQRVVFAASKQCLPSSFDDVVCTTVPRSSLPPDIYGPETDIQGDGRRNRPRWLDPGVVMGQAADLKLIYERILEYVTLNQNINAYERAFAQIYGRQEYVRELERRRTSSLWKEWLWNIIGISDASNITNVYLSLQPGMRYEFGIGLDFESQLFFAMNGSESDVEWIKYNDVERVLGVQSEHGVPRERRLTLPVDLTQNPFMLPQWRAGETAKPPYYNRTVDFLPDPKRADWHSLPLMTNVHTASVPAVIHANGYFSFRDSCWWKMWYRPWSRALLRKYMQSPLSGGGILWNMRGGNGGVWTINDQWFKFEEFCGGYETKLFDDRWVSWDEDGKPTYNQWGNLIAGALKSSRNV